MEESTQLVNPMKESLRHTRSRVLFELRYDVTFKLSDLLIKIILRRTIGEFERPMFTIVFVVFLDWEMFDIVASGSCQSAS